MSFETMKDADIVRNLKFQENRYTPQGLKVLTQYQLLLREAYRRGLRKEVLTPEQELARLEEEGPGFDRRV